MSEYDDDNDDAKIAPDQIESKLGDGDGVRLRLICPSSLRPTGVADLGGA